MFNANVFMKLKLIEVYFKDLKYFYCQLQFKHYLIVAVCRFLIEI